MFPEYRDLISTLKATDAHFSKLFERHNELDHEIRRLENADVPVGDVTIETLKKEKLHLKDLLYAILKKAVAPA